MYFKYFAMSFVFVFGVYICSAVPALSAAAVAVCVLDFIWAVILICIDIEKDERRQKELRNKR